MSMMVENTWQNVTKLGINMREELDHKLCADYPLIFKDRNGDMKSTLMCWGFSCGDGWYTIIDQLCSMLTGEYNQKKDAYDYVSGRLGEPMFGYKPDDTPAGVIITQEMLDKRKAEMDTAALSVPVAVQVKEKFGGLRFYVQGATDKHWNYISFAEGMSYRTCEECGGVGQRYTIGWHRTLCDIHADMAYGDAAEQYRTKTGIYSEEEDDVLQ